MVKSRRSLSSKQLRSLAKKHGIKTSGKKGTLAGRLRSRGVKVACAKRPQRRSPPRCKSRRSRRKSSRRSRKRSRCRFTSDSSFGDDDKESGFTRKQIEALRNRKGSGRKSPKRRKSRRSRRRSGSRRKGSRRKGSRRKSRRKSRSRRKGSRRKSRRCRHGTKDDGTCRKKPGPKRSKSRRKSTRSRRKSGGKRKLKPGSGPADTGLGQYHGGRGLDSRGRPRCPSDKIYDMRVNYGKGGCRKPCAPGEMYNYQTGRCRDLQLSRALKKGMEGYTGDYKCPPGEYYKDRACHKVPGGVSGQLADEQTILKILNEQDPCKPTKDGVPTARSAASGYECVAPGALLSFDSDRATKTAEAAAAATEAAKAADESAKSQTADAQKPVDAAMKALSELKETHQKALRELQASQAAERTEEASTSQTKNLERSGALTKLQLQQQSEMAEAQMAVRQAQLTFQQQKMKINIERQKAAMEAAQAKQKSAAAAVALQKDATVNTDMAPSPALPEPDLLTPRPNPAALMAGIAEKVKARQERMEAAAASRVAAADAAAAARDDAAGNELLDMASMASMGVQPPPVMGEIRMTQADIDAFGA